MRQLKVAPIVRKLVASVVLVVMFLLGRHIPLPYLGGGVVGQENSALDMALTITGGAQTDHQLFSLGLSPMMYGLILSQLFSLGKHRRTVSIRRMEYQKNTIVLLVAIIQSLGFVIQQMESGIALSGAQVVQLVLILVAGAFVVMWLSQLNTAYGFGGQTLLLLVSLLLNQVQLWPVLIGLWQSHKRWIILIFVAWLLVMLYVMVLFERAEYRILLQRLAIHSRYASQSYLPIRVNVAGGMPLMYAYTFMSLPVYVLLLLRRILPDIGNESTWMLLFSTRHVYGVMLYLVVTVLLTFLLAFVNVDVVQLAEDMRQSGDYILDVRSGRATRDYLAFYVRFFAACNSLYLVVFVGVPMLFALKWVEIQSVVGLLGMSLMTAGMVLGIIEEIRVMRLKKRYQSLFE